MGYVASSLGRAVLFKQCSLRICFSHCSTSHREQSPRPTTKIFISLLKSSYLMVLWLWTTPGIWSYRMLRTAAVSPDQNRFSAHNLRSVSDIYFRYESAEKCICTPVGKNPDLPPVLCLQVTDCSVFHGVPMDPVALFNKVYLCYIHGTKYWSHWPCYN